MGQKKYVDSTEQLVTEIVVRDIQRSTRFYRQLGFKVLRDAGDFVELTWEDYQLYIAELSAYHEINSEEMELPYPPKFPIANIRIMGFGTTENIESDIFNIRTSKTSKKFAAQQEETASDHEKE